MTVTIRGSTGMSDERQVLLDRANEGDADALTTLLEEVGTDVRRALSMPRRHQSVLEPDDIMQVTYVEAFLRFPQFVGDDLRAFTAWLHRIAQNNLNDAIRGLERDKRPPAERRITAPRTDDSYVALCDFFGVSNRTPSRIAAAAESKQLIETALRKLPPLYADVIRGFELEGCSGPEVSERIGRSRGAAFMLLARARDRLREVLGSESRFFSRPGP
jgi:RNA polymerase sigma-70 factor (ECF subfamily)